MVFLKILIFFLLLFSLQDSALVATAYGKEASLFLVSNAGDRGIPNGLGSVRAIVQLKENRPLPEFSHNIVGEKRNRAEIFEGLRRRTKRGQAELVDFVKKGRLLSSPSRRLRKEGKAAIELCPDVNPRNLWIANCVALTLRPEEIQEVKQHPDVMEVFENVILSVPPVESEATDSPPDGGDLWNHSAIGVDAARALGLDGTGIRIGCLDTGIISDHPDFDGKLIAWAEFDAEGEKVESLPHESHYLGHGTHVASVMVGQTTGVAPGADLISALVLPDGCGTLEQVLSGMQWVLDPDNDPETDDGAQVVNMSWGMAGTSPVLSEAVANMTDAEVLAVCAIGNSGGGLTYCPGNVPEAIGVGATNEYDHVLAFSGGGYVCWENRCVTKPDISAPGTGIWGLDPSGNYQTLTGTSVASPHVSGAAALLLQYDASLSLSQLRVFLFNASADLGPLGQDERYGWGRIELESAFVFIDRYAQRSGAADLIMESVKKINDIYSIHRYHTYFSDGQREFLDDDSDVLQIVSHSEQSRVKTLGVGDVDGNGFVDLLVTETSTADGDMFQIKYNVCLSLHAAAFSKRIETWYSFLSTFREPYEVIGIADVNGDNKADLVLADREKEGIGELIRVSVLLSDGAGFYTNSSPDWTIIYTTQYYDIDIGLGDVDGDGKSDLVYGKAFKDFHDLYPIYYYVGLSTGDGFQTLSNWLTIFPDWRKGALHYGSMSDLNGDGADDLIVWGQGGVTPYNIGIYVYPSDGHSSFGYSTRWAQVEMVNDSVEFETTGDVNGDGVDDLIISHFDAGTSLGLFSIWLADEYNEGFVWTGETSLYMDESFNLVGVGDGGMGGW